MKYTAENHTFALCAYKENPYLENCILSLLNQTTPSNVILCTSTPNEYISDLAKKYNLPIFVNSGKTSLFDDFNFAYSCAKTELVTICHQDDYYYPEYVEKSLAQANRSRKMLILFTEYCEDRNGVRVSEIPILHIKRIMNSPFRFRPFWGSKWVRRRILSIGNSICCPSVMFNKALVGANPFYTEFKCSGDWMTWTQLTKRDGDFIYCPDNLMDHRVWEGSETTRLIADSTRTSEDYQIFCEYWPPVIAKWIFKWYVKAEDSNG